MTTLLRKASTMRLSLLLLVPLLGVSLASCGDDDSAGPEEGATVEDVREDEAALDEDDAAADDAAADEGVFDEDAFFEDPEPYLGETVTVSAEVADIFEPTAFSIAGEGGPQPVLVVSAPDAVPEITDNAVVEVTGTVEEFTIVDVEEDLGIDLDDELYTDFEDEHVLVADSVQVLDPEEDGEDG